MISEKDRMSDLRYLPVLRDGVKVHYEGSIDKSGGNADWDWWLYQDGKGEWVIFDYEGAGCIFNFVQHRYPDCEEPTFRFYFDGEDTPRFTIRHSQFGERYPFVEPLASRYIGPEDHGRGPIRVVRSFVPMPFSKSCKITSDICLKGCERTANEGGWGHVVFHSYASSDPIRTFSSEDDYRKLIQLWKNPGSPVIPFEKAEQVTAGPFELKPGESRVICESSDAGLISGIHIKTRGYKREHLSNLLLRAAWDHHKEYDLQGNFGCIFANELGYNSVRYLLAGMCTNGTYYNYYPMPFGKSAFIEIVNYGSETVRIDYTDITYTREYNDFYKQHSFGYFRSSKYYERKHTEGADSIIACIPGSGHMAGSVITGYGKSPDSRADCEGDVRIHFDGIRTPQVESDGSESYVCYGWGFETPNECNPASGYDGHEHKDWSMSRLLMGDTYPFLSQLRFQIESGGNNDCYMEHSGMVFYYGTDEIKTSKTAEIIMGDHISENSSQYVSLDGAEVVEQRSFFEGDEDDVPVTLKGRYTKKGCKFQVKIAPKSRYIILRRVSDQGLGRQKAIVFIDDREVMEYPWYFVDRNSMKRWLEDEFVIPYQYLEGKNRIEVRIVPVETDGEVNWNEFGYQVFTVI